MAELASSMSNDAYEGDDDDPGFEVGDFVEILGLQSAKGRLLNELNGMVVTKAPG